MWGEGKEEVLRADEHLKPGFKRKVGKQERRYRANNQEGDMDHFHHHQPAPLYSRLPGNNIRLLRLHRQDVAEHGTSGPGLSGALETFRLNGSATPKYTAISYVWGDNKIGEKGPSISLNGHLVQILRSVRPILETCKRLISDEDPVTQWIWIDSICINQQDLQERAKQVTLMGRIFRQAERVLVWLGEEDGLRSVSGMEMIRLIAGIFEEPDFHDLRLEDLQAWRDFEAIAKKPWFRRAWTLQESLVPQGEVVFYCGDESVSERQMRNAIWKGMELRQKYMPGGSTLDETSFAPMWIRRRIVQWYLADDHGEEISLLALLAYHGHAQCSDDRDRLYSLLGCVNTADRELVGLPDYGLPVEKIYIDFVKNWIQEHRSLDILCFAGLFPPAPNGDLPSWVPDWRNRASNASSPSPKAIDTNPLPLLASQSSRSQIGNLRPRRFHPPRDPRPVYMACGSTVPTYGFDADDKILFCTGVVVEMIDGVAALVSASSNKDEPEILEAAIQSTTPTNSSTFNESEARFHTLKSQLAIPGDISAMADVIRREVAVSLVLGRGDIYLNHPADAHRILAHISAMFAGNWSSPETQDALAWFKANESFQIRGLHLGEAFPSIPLDPEYVSTILSETESFQVEDSEDEGLEHPFSSKFSLSASPHHMAMRLCVTESGTTGMVPRRARKGDSICVLFGCNVPVVLRRADGSGLYEFIGECYLQTIMEGEAMRNGNQAQTFGLL